MSYTHMYTHNTDMHTPIHIDVHVYTQNRYVYTHNPAYMHMCTHACTHTGEMGG